MCRVGPGEKHDTIDRPLHGKILVGGAFYSGTGTQTPREYLARLLPDGTSDADFNARLDNVVLALVPQPDGKIILGGYFQSVGGGNRPKLARINEDGTLDETFNPGVIQDGFTGPPIQALALQPDGKLIIGGNFSSVGGQNRRNIARLHPNGAVDNGFLAQAGNPSGEMVQALALQPDGKVLVGGRFSELNRTPRFALGRFNTNGTLDTTFQSTNVNFASYPGVSALALQTDGGIVFGGSYYSAADGVYYNLGRLHADGTQDPAFAANVNWHSGNNPVETLLVQRDGRILVGGNFSVLTGRDRLGLGRLGASDPAQDELVLAEDAIQWNRRGAGPEFSRTLFESSLDGMTWTMMGEGTRVAGGWRHTAMAAPTGMAFRGRGFVSGGGDGDWYVEATSMAGMRILPGSMQSNPFGFTLSAPAGQTVVIEGSEDFLNWTPLKTNVVDGEGLIGFTDPDAAGLPRRFYRGRTQ